MGERLSRAPNAVMVAHSGPGALAASVRRTAANRRRQRTIFLDAILPHPGQSWFDTVPSALAHRIIISAADGRAPPWPQRLPAGTLERLVPDSDLRKVLLAEADDVPLSYLEAVAPSFEDWPDAFDGAYLRTSAAYDREAARAEDLDWPVERIDGNHLSLMTEPEKTASLILELASA